MMAMVGGCWVEVLGGVAELVALKVVAGSYVIVVTYFWSSAICNGFNFKRQRCGVISDSSLKVKHFKMKTKNPRLWGNSEAEKSWLLAGKTPLWGTTIAMRMRSCSSDSWELTRCSCFIFTILIWIIHLKKIYHLDKDKIERMEPDS